MSKSFIQILILTIITIVAIIGFDLHRNTQKTTLPKIVEEQLAPLDPNLQLNVFDKLQKKSVPPKEELPTLSY